MYISITSVCKPANFQDKRILETKMKGENIMENQIKTDFYISRKSKLLRDFDKYMKKFMRKVLLSYFDEDDVNNIIEKTRKEYESLIPKLPYIGKRNPFMVNLVQSAWCLALYRVLKTYGKTMEEVGKILYEATEEKFSSYPGWLLKFAGAWMFAENRVKKLAERAQKREYPGDWVWSYVEGDGVEFDFGVDFIECGVCKFFKKQGAEEFVPYLCLLDFPGSKASGSGLARTMTIAEGGEKCDFRFKRGREVKQGWPPHFQKRMKRKNIHRFRDHR